MPQTKKRVARPRRTTHSRHSHTAVATHTVSSTKLALSTLFLGFAALAAAAAGSLPASNTGSSSKSTTSSKIIFYVMPDKTGNRIATPADGEVSLGKWTVKPRGEAVRVNRLTFDLKTYSGNPANVADFYDLALYANGIKVATGAVTQNYILFSENGLFDAPKNTPVTLELRGKVAATGVMEPGAVRAWEIGSDALSKMNVVNKVTAEIVEPEQIVLGHGSYGKPDVPATSFPILVHNSVPVITSQTLDQQLVMGAAAPLFKVTVANRGTRELTLKNLNLPITVSGLAPAVSGTLPGIINDFTLYEGNYSGGFTPYALAKHPLCISGSNITSPVKCRATDGKAESVSFKFAENFTIAPGSSRTLVVTANTTGVSANKMPGGNVLVKVELVNEVGFKPGNNLYEKNWGDSGLIYSYTPINNNGVAAGPFSATMESGLVSTVIRYF